MDRTSERPAVQTAASSRPHSAGNQTEPPSSIIEARAHYADEIDGVHNTDTRELLHRLGLRVTDLIERQLNQHEFLTLLSSGDSAVAFESEDGMCRAVSVLREYQMRTDDMHGETLAISFALLQRAGLVEFRS